MKKTLRYFVAIFVTVVTVLGVACAELKMVPYYSLQFTEGAFVPSKGEWNFALNMLSDLGVIAKPADAHSIVGFYELKYTGPGLKRQEGEKFTDSAMDHLGVLRYSYNITENDAIKPQIDYMKEYKRTGSNELWGSGLYDFNRIGGGLTFTRKLSDNAFASVTGQYHLMDFPNYTDLLAEFQAGGSNVESSTGKQNHKLIQAGLAFDVDVNHLAIDLILMNYTKQKIAADTVQPSGSYYSEDLQKDNIINVSVSRYQEIGDSFSLSPYVSYKAKKSNQNFLYFATVNSTEVPRFFGNYYDYDELDVALPIAVDLSSVWEFSVTPELDYKMYKQRPPRAESGAYLDGEKQNNRMTIISTGLTLKPNAVTRTTFFYVFQTQTSNMKFEKYLPYNYTGNFGGIKFEYTF
jgi:hypothetical protein